MRKILFFFIFLIAIKLQGQSPSDARLKSLDSFVNKVLKDWHAAGVGVAIVEKNKVLFAGGFGFRDYEKKLPVTDKTLFAIGSCTKAFTASLLGMLEKEGKLDLNKPVSNYLPDLKFQNEYLTQHVTAKDMMSHRTGLPRHDMSWYAFPTTRDSLLKRIAFMEANAELRERYQYNNFMFLVQGLLAEKLTGKSWEQNIREKIFQPLGMTTTNFSINDMKSSADASRGYYEKKDSIRKMDYYNIDAIGPAGSINSSASEMANWVMTWIYGGKFKGKEIIPSSFTTQAMSSQMVSGPGLPDKQIPDAHFATYGFAWTLSSYRGHYRVSHGGNIDGFSAITSFFPTDSIGIVVLSNQNGSTVPGIIRNYIADKLLQLPIKDWSSLNKAAVFQQRMAQSGVKKSDSLYRKPNTKPSHALKEYTGSFQHPGYGTMDIVLRNDSLIAISPTVQMWLQHYHYDIFKPFALKEDLDLEEDNPVRMQFHMNTRGEIESISAIGFEPAVKQILFTKQPTVVKLEKAALQKYAGDYLLNGTTINIFIKGENTLIAFIPGQPEYELVPTGDHQFNIKVLDGYKVKFILNEKNEAKSLQFIQPNGIFSATRK